MADANVATRVLGNESFRDFVWEDPLGIEVELTEEERILDRAQTGIHAFA